MEEKQLANIDDRPERQLTPALTGQAAGGDKGGGGRSDSGTAGRRGAPLLIALALFAAAAAVSGAFLGGFEVATRRMGPYAFMVRVDGKISRLLKLERERAHISDVISTALLNIRTDVGDLGAGNRDPATGEELHGGGGMTTFGRDVLVLPYNGRIYAARSGSEIRATRIRAPRTNRAAYVALIDSPGHEGYEFGRTMVRYEDLHYYNSGSSQGLLASYVEFHPDRECYVNAVARLPFPAGVQSIDQVTASPDDWTVVYRTRPCLTFKRQYLALEGMIGGGRLAFAPPSTVYLTSGDFHWDGIRSNTEAIAQDPAAEYGKVLSFDLNTGRGRVVSMGLRNMQGLVLDPGGRLFVLDHGPRGGDELNLYREGANYGWPRESYGTTYMGLRIPNSVSYGRHDSYETPIFAWLPSVGTSGLTRVEGFNEAWNGDLLASSLTGRSLFRLRMQGDRVVYAERIEVGTRIRDVHQHSDGRIVLLTDNYRLIFLSPAARQAEQIFVSNHIDSLSGAMRDRMTLALETCTQCHSFVTGANEKAPSLARVYGSDIASSSYAGYSEALKARGGRWTREALLAFVEDPQRFAPGTAMPDPRIGDSRVREELVNLLQRMKESY